MNLNKYEICELLINSFINFKNSIRAEPVFIYCGFSPKMFKTPHLAEEDNTMIFHVFLYLRLINTF